MPVSRQTLSTGEPDAGEPPVRFGGRGDLKTVVPTPICACCYLPDGPDGFDVGLPSHPDVPLDLPEGLGPVSGNAEEALRDWAGGNFDAILRLGDLKIVLEPYVLS